MAQNPELRPTVEDFRADNQWVKLAHAHWTKTTKVRKVKHNVVKNELWDVLEAEGFSLRSLLTLENLSVLEKYARCPVALVASPC